MAAIRAMRHYSNRINNYLSSDINHDDAYFKYRKDFDRSSEIFYRIHHRSEDVATSKMDAFLDKQDRAILAEACDSIAYNLQGLKSYEDEIKYYEYLRDFLKSYDDE